MYIFKTEVFQSGGGTGDGTLMKSGKSLDIRQYFQTSGWEAVEFANAGAFCDFLASKWFKDGRKVFFKEEANSRSLTVYSTSPYEDYENEIFTIGILEQIN